MRIIGFNLTKISVQRDEAQKKQSQINQDINIKDVKEEDIPISKDKAIKITFNLTISYSDDFAKIEFEGSVLILPDKEELEKFMEGWKDKKIPETTRIPLFNFIMGKCNIKALALEDEMNLPLHIPMPRISAEGQQQSTPQPPTGPNNFAKDDPDKDNSKK
jgi:hypothetical protein